MRRTLDQGIIYSPSDLTTFLESPFESWMNRHDLEFPGLVKDDVDDGSAALVQAQGTEHERRVRAALAQEFGAVEEIPSVGDFEARHVATISAMKKGAPVIYQAALRHPPFMGYADFLIRVSGESVLGSYHYEAWDSKLARSTKPYFVIQLLAYSEMLHAAQKRHPERITVVLGSGERKVYRAENFRSYYQLVKRRFLRFQDAFDPARKPLPRKNETLRRWSTHAAELIARTDDLSLVADIRSSQIRKLKQAGIRTLTELAGTELRSVPRMERSILERLKRQARLQLESKHSQQPKFELLHHPENERLGLRLLPPPSSGDVYFDMEGYPLFDDQGLEYLFGAVYLEPETGPGPRFIDFWAHSRVQEKKAFEAWVDWVHARFQRDPRMHIYHYAPYEVTAMRRLSTRHATREAEIDRLLRNDVFVDLYRIVKQSLAVGEPSYSIKNIEHLYSRKREGEVTSAGASIVEYAKYVGDPDGPDWNTSKILKSIRDYNEADCLSTLRLADWLRDLQARSKLPYLPVPLEGMDEQQETGQEIAALARKLLGELDTVKDLSPEQRVQKLLAELLEYHRREAKQYWWKYFDWIAKPHIELIEDSECIGNIRRTGSAPVREKRSQIAEYIFDPNHDVKFEAGSACQLYIDRGKIYGTEIERIDREAGTLTIKLGDRRIAEIGGFPQVASILPGAPVDTRTLRRAIHSITSRYQEGRSRESLPPPLADFLLRNIPRIDQHTPGDPLAIHHIQRMAGSSICIQGPPGAGKTYTGGRVILSLLKSGKRIGVTSNSHHAIENLMSAVFSGAVEEKAAITGYKSGGDNVDFFEKTGFTRIESRAIGSLSPAANGHYLVGGTAWTFARDEAVETLDYLFVDEAGQMSIANLVAVSRSASNLVLMGDQRQLEQPTQGAHPGESGESCLNYFLRDQVTIPPELGLFLEKTYRMRPEVCDFISRSFYDGRLQSDESTRATRLRLSDNFALVKKSEGMEFIPVIHEDNSQSSPEEAETIAQIIHELLQARLTEKGQERAVTHSDIMVVAPYNLQVKLLTRKLPSGIAVGTVDKFQGKEAAVVILSMCSSSLDESPRGIEFLFNPNRLNVAISRAKCLAVVVGNPALALAEVGSVEKMRLVNLFCKMVGEVETV